MRLTLVSALAALALFQPATSWTQTAGSVQARGAWVRATPPGATTGAFYVTLTSSRNDKLIGASSPSAARSSLHETSMTEGGVMEMRRVEGGLALPAGRPVTLGPRGLHIMMEGLEYPLKVGMTVPMHLTFENSPGMDIYAPVRPIGAVDDGTSVDTGMRGMDMGH